MRTPAAWLRGVRHPEAYHGDGVRHGFFEGWYIKLVSADRAQRWAVIPGIFRPGDSGGGRPDDGAGSGGEAFVQVLDGLSGRSWFHPFPVEAFRASDREFDVEVGANRFWAGGVELDLPQLRGRLRYSSPLQPWPVTAREPGIMGWYGLVPFMECFHGVVSFGHELTGSLEIDGVATEFDRGRGYIEKDWGQGFPAGYVWLASNHLDTGAREEAAAREDAAAPEEAAREDAATSLVASVAIIPWLGGSFRGFILGLRHGGRLHRWATYNRSRETRLQIDDTHVRWSVTGRDGTLDLEAERVRGGLLHAPLRGATGSSTDGRATESGGATGRATAGRAMRRRVEETLDAQVAFRHTAPDGRVLLEGVGDCAGLEVFGDTGRLLGLRT